MSNARKGAARERELVNELTDYGIPAMRIGASGGGTSQERPDIMFHIPGATIVAEMKYTSGEYAYFEGEEIQQLKKFAKDWEAIPIAIGRFKRDTTWYVIPLHKQTYYRKYYTDGNNLSMKKKERGEYQELFRYLKYVERALENEWER